LQIGVVAEPLEDHRRALPDFRHSFHARVFLGAFK
jgi:hypothetical protein